MAWVTRIAARDHALAKFRHYELLVVVYLVVLLVSNLVGQKMSAIGPFRVSGAQLLFPITYIFSDIFTEVYGYAGARRAIWMGFFSAGLMALLGMLMVWIPGAPEWPAEKQRAFEIVLGAVPRMVAASLVAFWVGEFVNAYVMARMKVLTRGRWLWTRTIGSTVAGQAADSLLVNLGFFLGTVPLGAILNMALSGYVAKVLYEAAATPLTYWIVHVLKRREGVDLFDEGTDFSPFAQAPRPDPGPGRS